MINLTSISARTNITLCETRNNRNVFSINNKSNKNLFYTHNTKLTEKYFHLCTKEHNKLITLLLLY